MQTITRTSTLSRTTILLLILAVIMVTVLNSLPVKAVNLLVERLSVFATVFLGIFFEAAPFLLLGTLASGIVEVFVNQDWLQHLVPRRALPAALVGALMGLVFPVCECGVVPLVRRLFRKGLPIPAGIAFLLAAPVLNPIVILSTATAFGWGRVLFLRLALSLVIAVFTGLVFAVERAPWGILRPTAWVTVADVEVDEHDHSHSQLEQTHRRPTLRLIDKLRQVFVIAADEFFEIGRYLIIGGALAALMQALIPQSALLAAGHGPVASVIVMMALAVLLSICSTVDAFVALGFAGTFSFGSIMAFLIFGPMVDIKSTMMFLRVFRKRPVAYLILLPLLMSFLAGLAINYYLP